MNKFVRTRKRNIGVNKVQRVNARGLHKILESKSSFSNWIADRIKEYGFTEGTDFMATKNYLYILPLKKYHLSIDMAKEISILEPTAKGRQFRQYFSWCEWRLKMPAIFTEIELLAKEAQNLVRDLRKQFKQEGRLKEIER